MEPSSFSASASSPRQRAYFGSGAFAAYPPASRASDPFESHITSAMTLVAHGCCLLLPLMTQVHLRALQLHAGDGARLCARSIPPSFVCWRRGRAASVRRICSRHREKGGIGHHFEGHSRLCCLWVYQCMCFYQTIVVIIICKYLCTPFHPVFTNPGKIVQPVRLITSGRLVHPLVPASVHRLGPPRLVAL